MRTDLDSRRYPLGWVDLLLLLGSVVLLVSSARAGLRAARIDADIGVVSHEAKQLYDAFVRFEEANGRFPAAHGEIALERISLDPLKRRGYYKGTVATRLVDGRVDAYVSSGAEDRPEFWLEMSLVKEPGVRFLVARSDDAPLGGGKWRDGAFVFRDGELEPL
jgi:hypothetical protein